MSRPEDGDALAKLHRAAFGEGSSFGATYWRQDRSAAPGLCVVAEEGGALAAYCDGFLAGGGGDVSSIGTAPGARGRGLGRLVLEGFLAEAASRGAAVIHLEVAEGNAPALALYARAGFTVVGRRRAYYEDGADALVMAASVLPKDGAEE